MSAINRGNVLFVGGALVARALVPTGWCCGNRDSRAEMRTLTASSIPFGGTSQCKAGAVIRASKFV